MQIEPSSEAACPGYLKPFFWRQRRKYGTEQHINALRELFDDGVIVEFNGLIAFQNLSSKFKVALGDEPQGFCEMPHPTAADLQANPEIEKPQRRDQATSISGSAIVRYPTGGKQWKN